MKKNMQLLLDAFHKEDLIDYAFSSQNNMNDQYYSYMNLPKQVLDSDATIKTFIPRISNYIWFTNENNPKEIPEKFLTNLKLELVKINNYNMNALQPWKIKLWVNCKACIPMSLEHISQMQHPVEVIEWQFENFGVRSNLQKIVTYLIHMKNGMGAAIDIARYIIAEKEGGFFIDFDYNTGNSTEIIVQRGYHSITQTENNYFGFMPQHKILVQLNNYISSLFEAVEKYDLSAEFLSLGPNQIASFFSYGPFNQFVEKFSEKEELSIKPECLICDKKEELMQCSNDYYDNDESDDDIKQCSIDAPEICYVAEHSAQIENSSICYLLIEEGGIDFGSACGSLGENWILLA